MRIKLGAIITEVSGKLGGHAAQTSLAGSTLRAKATQKRKPSRRQLSRRFAMTRITQKWRVLPAFNRNLWVHYPYMGFTGFESFKSVNLLRLQAGLGLLINPSPVVFPAEIKLTSFICDKASSQVRVNFNAVPLTTVAFMTSLAVSYSPGQSARPRNMTFVNRNQNIGQVTLNFFNQYRALFGNLVVGSRVTIAIFGYSNSMHRTTVQSLSSIVT